jgi:uncharacterized protein
VADRTGSQVASGAGNGRLLDGEAHRLSPRMRTVWILSGALPGGVISIGLFGVLATVDGPHAIRNAAIASIVVLTIWLVAVVLIASWAWSVWRWTPWEDALELTHGPVIRKSSLVPYHRIQQIDVHRDPVERVLGLSTLILRTAAATTDARLAGIQADRADQLRHALLSRAGVDDAV